MCHLGHLFDLEMSNHTDDQFTLRVSLKKKITLRICVRAYIIWLVVHVLPKSHQKYRLSSFGGSSSTFHLRHNLSETFSTQISYQHHEQ